jgi:arylsulfatase A-like enzyme
LGIAVGVIDAAYMALTLRPEGKIHYLNHLFWLWVPLTWVALCLGVALLFSLPRLRRLLVPALVFAGPGLLLLSRSAYSLRDVQGLSTRMIAVGWLVTMGALGWLATRFLDIRPISSRRSFAIAGGCWLAVTAAVFAVSGNPPVAQQAAKGPPAGGRNVVLVFLDTVRYDDTSLDRFSTNTPNLARFATESVTFDNAWAPAPWTLPSHSAVFTGIEPWRSSAGATTMAERFSHMGFETSAIFSNPLLNPSIDFTRGFQHLTYSMASAPCQSGLGHLILRLQEHDLPLPRVCGLMLGDEITGRATAFIEKAQRPYFLTLNYYDGHFPYFVPKECRGAEYDPYDDQDIAAMHRVEQAKGTLPPDSATQFRNQHRLAIKCMDRSLGTLFTTLRKQPDYDKTIVVVVADHGEQFGAHSLVGHGNSLYRQLLHVPLVVRIPGRAPGRVDSPVSIVDLHETLLEAAGARRNPGTDLALFDVTRRRPAVAEYLNTPTGHESFSAANYRFHLILGLDKRQELYDYTSDPTEEHPLTEGYESSDLVKRIEAARRQWDGTRSTAAVFRSLGYLE